MVERKTLNLVVAGSSPAVGEKKINIFLIYLFIYLGCLCGLMDKARLS